MQKSSTPSSSIYTWCEVDGAHEGTSRAREVDEDGSPRRFQLQSDTQTGSHNANNLRSNHVVSERAQETVPRQPGFTSTISRTDALTPLLHDFTNSTAENCQTLESSTSSSSDASATDMLRIHIGIGIGAAIAGIALGALISIICMRYRRRKTRVDLEAKGAETRQRDEVLMTNIMSHCPATQMIPRGERAYEARENSSIYPDESASFYEPDASPRTMRAYATDFAMADRQVWREHIPSSPDLGLGIRQHPGLDIEANESAGAKDEIPTEPEPVASTHM